MSNLSFKSRENNFAVGEHSAALKKIAEKAAFGTNALNQRVFYNSPSISVPTLEERLFNSRAACKMAAAQIAMHLTRDARDKLFVQLDNLLDAEEWDPSDQPVSQASFVSFLRTIIFIKPERRPGLGVTSEGNLIAAWTSGPNRLTVTFSADDEIQWVINGVFEGQKESAAGKAKAVRLLEVLAPYEPGLWFAN